MSGKCDLLHLRWLGFLAVLLAALPALAAKSEKPDFGPNVLVFDPSMSSQAIQKQIDAIYAVQEHNEFGKQRNALFFLPGNYSVDVPVGFYTEVIGLGESPDATRISGNMHADANHEHNNATTTFWRAASGLSITPAGGTMQWAVSQAVSLRRMHMRGDLVLHQHHGWASGGWMSDSLVDGNVDAGSQQQWISRNCDWKSWTGSNWNMVFVGVVHPPAGAWPQPPYTTVARTPIVREKPFLQVNATGEFSVRVPSLHTDSVGITWRGGETPGETIPIAHFYIARPDVDTAGGKSTPGLPTAGSDSHAGHLRSGHSYSRYATRASSSSDSAARRCVPSTAPQRSPPPTRTASRSPASCSMRDRRNLPCSSKSAPKPAAPAVRKTPITFHDVFFRVGGAGVVLRQNRILSIEQHYPRRPHMDLARRPRRRCRLAAQHQRKWPRRQWKRRYDLWLICRASPAIPGSVERKWRPYVFLSVRDSVRSSHPSGVHQRPRRERMGFLQSGGWSHQPRGVGPRHLQCLYLPRRGSDPSHRDAQERADPVPRHDHRRPRRSRRHQPRHQ